MARHQRRSARAFTLIELLVVVAIIALLISILLPSLSRARETSRLVACLSVHKQMSTANFMYADANQQFYVPLGNNVAASSSSSGNKGAWMVSIPFRQLLGLRIGGSNSVAGQGNTAIPGLVCPSKQPADAIEKGWWYRAFSWNACGNVNPGSSPAQTILSVGGVSRAKVKHPASKVLGMDAVSWDLRTTSTINADIHWDVHGDTSVSTRRHMAYRHLDQTNQTMHDGSARNFTRTEAYPTQANQRNFLYGPYTP